MAAALTAPDADADVAAATAVWQQRCETILGELAGYPVIRPHGGWSLLVDAGPLGLTPAALSQRLFGHGKVAATPMDGWGPSGDRYLRLVFANEPAERLAGLGDRFRRALGQTGLRGPEPRAGVPEPVPGPAIRRPPHRSSITVITVA